MAKRLNTEAALARIAELRADAANVSSDSLRPLLKHRSNYVVAKAAAFAEERELADLTPELSDAFAYFLRDAVKRDPGCSAKLAIVNALSRSAQPAWDVYLAGVRHVQKEPAWGPPIDTAATLRGLCGRALVALGHAEAFRCHAALLADPEPMTRALAVETLGGAPDERAELLLRSKIARGDEERDPERSIEMDAFAALMLAAPEESLDFVSAYLRDPDSDRVRAAALAIGGSHDEGAFQLLTDRWRNADDETRTLLALPIALVRSDSAFQFLVAAIAESPAPLCEAIVEGLAIFREDLERAEAVRSAVSGRGGARLQRCYARHFEQPSAHAE